MANKSTLRKPKKTIKPWVIYLWRNGDKMEGAAPVVTKDGIKELFAYGWEIEKDPEAKRNEDKHKVWRAKTKIKNLLNNTLNVLNWYGKKVLDSRGNINPTKVAEAEAATALLAVNQKVDMEDLYKIKQFPTEDITPQKAKEYKFI